MPQTQGSAKSNCQHVSGEGLVACLSIVPSQLDGCYVSKALDKIRWPHILAFEATCWIPFSCASTTASLDITTNKFSTGRHQPSSWILHDRENAVAVRFRQNRPTSVWAFLSGAPINLTGPVSQARPNSCLADSAPILISLLVAMKLLSPEGSEMEMYELNIAMNRSC